MRSRQDRPASTTLRKSVSFSVGELKPLEAIWTATSCGIRRTTPPSGSPPIDAYSVLLVDRAIRERTLESRAEHEREERKSGDRPDAGAHGGQALAKRRPVGLVVLPAGQQLEVALAQLRAAETANAEPDRQDRDRREPDDRARVEEHHESVEDRPHPPQERAAPAARRSGPASTDAAFGQPMSPSAGSR